MIRSAAFSLLTLGLVLVGFYVYWQYQPKISFITRPATTSPSPLVRDDAHMQIGPGKRAWAQSFDDKGRLSSSFRAAEFTPQKDRSFRVVHPESIFYLENGQYMFVTGDHGIVFAEGSGSASPTDASPIHPPSNGILQDVTILLYPNHNAAKPTLKITMNNARFDNDTLRLYTQAYQDASGNTVPADMVPVTVRGDDYDFDGTGLTLRWDDRDHRLQLLEIAHGKRLVIKHPSKLSMPGETVGTSAHTLAVPGASEEESARSWTGAALVDAAPNAAALALPPPEPSNRGTVYRAIFHDDVRIDQGNLQVVAADEMTVDFLQKGAGKTAATAPAVAAPAAAVASAGDVDPTIPIAVQQMTAPEATAAAVVPRSSSVATEPNPPITVYWTGKLRITPLNTTPILPVPAGQAVVKLIGSPVVMTPQGSTMKAATVIYRSGDSAGLLANSEAIPQIELKQDKLNFVATSLTYDPGTARAVVQGPSRLKMTMEDGQRLDASWTDRGVFHVVPKGGQPDFVDHGDLYGNVVVKHPRFNLTSKQLALDMEKSTTQPNVTGGAKEGLTLKRATAIGNAVCKLTEDQSGQREIDGDKVVIETMRGADGKPIPRSISADGSVRAFDPDQKLTAGHLEALLRPKSGAATTRSDDANAMELESMSARDNVIAVLKNGTIAEAEQLHVMTKNGHQEVALTGQPAKVDDGKGGILTGPSIFILPDESSFTVDGAGRMSRMRHGEAHPLVVSWGKSLHLDGPENTVDVIGNVEANAIDANGTAEDMMSDSAHADLMQAPTTQKSKSSSSGEDEFGGKVLKVLTLSGSVHGTSMLKAADGSILRHGEIWGPTLKYLAESGRTEIPGAGRLLVENHKPATQPTQAAGDPNSAGGNYGNLAMKWNKSLVYDPAAQKTIFDGDVVAMFQQDAKDAEMMTLEHANTITAYLEPAPTTEPVMDNSKQPRMQLSHVTANGAVIFHAKAFNLFDADRVNYDPKTNLLIARGKDEQPARVQEQDGNMSWFEEVVFNVKTQLLVSSKSAKGGVRR